MPTESTPKKDSSPGVTIAADWRVAHVRAKNQYRLEVDFLDGTHGVVDLGNFIHSSNAGVFAVLKDLSVFNQVFVEYGVVTWPGGLDLAPDAMYDEIKKTGTWNVPV